MKFSVIRLVVVGLAVFLIELAAISNRVCAQSDGDATSNQIWANITLDFPRSRSLLLELDFEPKAQVSGAVRWRTLDVTGLAEYYPNRWLDLTGELVTGVTEQTNELHSLEGTVRLGMRLHLLSTFRDFYKPERTALYRLGLGVWFRLERRNVWYSDETESHENRFRIRLELKLALNNTDLAADRTLYLMTDAEAFARTDDPIRERFASKFRYRGGFGYRLNYGWRFELLFQYDQSRDTLDQEFDVDAYVIDFRLKRFF